MIKATTTKIRLLAFILLLITGNVHAQNNTRQTVDLNRDWTIYPAYNVGKVEKEKVNLPHTWNTKDVFEKINYSREAMMYQRKIFIGNDLADKRLFLYFEGVNSVASVFVNGKLAAEHYGGYTAFCVEITDLVSFDGETSLDVLVSNAYRTDVLPLSGDFNVYGGIHRPVHLLITGQNCISPLDFASSGVYVKPLSVSKLAAKVEIAAKLSVKKPGSGLQLRATILDATNKAVGTLTQPVPENNPEEVSLTFNIDKPNLWNGKQNPYCYQIDVELLNQDKVVDKVTETTGFRYYSVDPENGFYLNGEYLDLHGFGRHEDVAGKGSALTPDDYVRDMGLIKESGATALRLTHYPHGKKMYELGDENGIIIWTEIPFVGPGGYSGPGYIKSELLEKNIKTMLTEMIRQHYNHPSVFFWGMLNELKLDYDNPLNFVKELSALAKKEDPYRLTTCASFGDQDVFIPATDLIGWNEYFGWYGGMPNDIGPFMDQMKAKANGHPVCVTEFGAGASITAHSWPVTKPDPGSHFHPEEWQAVYHEGNWKELSSRKFVWGKFVWNFADFGSSIRNEGDKAGINDKGLVTYDRQIKKDAFYFYKANWNPEPMIYITSRRFTNRTNSHTGVKTYTTAKKADLFVNGKYIGTKNADEFKTIVWPEIELQKGPNQIVVKAVGNKQLTDSCTWILE